MTSLSDVYFSIYRLINVGESKENENGVPILGKLNLQSDDTDKLLQITVIPETPCLQVMLLVLNKRNYNYYKIYGLNF